MKKQILMCFFLVCVHFVHSQVLTVKDQEDYQPLEMVTITSITPLAATSTNALGEADISAFKNSVAIEIKMIGYQAQVYSYSELEKTGFVVYLKSSVVTFDQLIVSGIRWSQPVRQFPARVTTIQRKDALFQNPQTTADLLGFSGEVFIQKSQQGGGSPMIRGFATNRVLISVDGVRMNNAIFRSGNLQNVIAIDPFSIAKTEILFGPGSVMYGSDAIGGVMSFRTLSPVFSTSNQPLVSGTGVTRFSTANKEQTGHLSINVGWKKWAMLTSFSHFKFDDMRMGSKGPDEYLNTFYVSRTDTLDVKNINPDPMVQRPSGYEQSNVLQKIRFKPNEKWDFNYAFHYSTTTNVPRYDRLIRIRSNGAPNSAEWYYGPQTWIMNNLRIDHKSNTQLFDGMTVLLAQQNFEESRADRNFNANTRFSRLEKVAAYSANIDFNKKIGTRHSLFYGLEAVLNDVTSTGNDINIKTGSSQPGPARYPKSDWSSYAAYVTYQNKLGEKWLFSAGARYNHFVLNAVFDTSFYPFPFTTANINAGAVTGSIGLVYAPDKNWTVSINASTGFRSPNVDDLGKVFDSEPGFVVVPNPKLQAEYAYNAELGIARIFREKVKLDASLFYTLLDNALVRRDFTLGGMDSLLYDGSMSRVQAMQNAAKATVYGIQAGVEIKLPAGLNFSGHFNYQKGEEELDDRTVSPLRHATPWFGSAHLTYSVKRLRMDFYSVFSGQVSFANLAKEEQGKAYMYAIDAAGKPYSPSWYTLNLKSMYQISDNFSVSAGIENLSDVRYRPYSSGMVSAGRNFVFSLRTQF